MMAQVYINKGLQIPAFDLAMLEAGRVIAIPFKQSLRKGEHFWLCPQPDLPFDLSISEYYQPQYQAQAQQTISDRKFSITIQTWAKVEHHWFLYPDQKTLIYNIAKSGVWEITAIEKILKNIQVIRLLFLRVYKLSQPFTLKEAPPKGSFFWPKVDDNVTLATDNDLPIITATGFKTRQTHLTTGKRSVSKGLNDLTLQLKNISRHTTQYNKLKHDMASYLGITSQFPPEVSIPAWVKQISSLCHRSDEINQPKSNYQAGTEFEKVVRDGLAAIGFGVNESHQGGSGGLDFACYSPYSVIGECKSGQKIPDQTAVNLLKLGYLNLPDKKAFQDAVKLIIGPGKPTKPTLKAATVLGMSILKPETLESLVTFNYQYPGAIDLLQLKESLIDGQADDAVRDYLVSSKKDLEIRSQIVGLAKAYLDKTDDKSAKAYELYAVYLNQSNPALETVSRESFHDILIELSSPLTGYLGRKTGQDGEQIFYFLRDFVLEGEQSKSMNS